MMKKVKLTMIIFLAIFVIAGCASNNNNNKEEQVIKYSEEVVIDAMNSYYDEYYPNGPNGTTHRELDDGTVIEITFLYYYDSDFEEMAYGAVVDLYTGDVIETGSDGTITDEYNIEDILTEDKETEAETEYAVSLEKLEGRVIIRPNFQGILGEDGYVYARGENKYGELGNGEREPNYNWCKVEELENVVGIYASLYFGDYNHNSFEGNQHCYALTKEGDVYRWGANILTPQKVDLFPKVKTITQSTDTTDTMFIFRCENSETYILKASSVGGGEDTVIPYHSLDESAKIAYIDYDFDAVTYAILDKSEVIYIRNNNVSDFSKHNIFHVEEMSFEEGIVEQHVIDTGAPIMGMFGKYLLTDEGSVIRVDYEGGSVQDIPITELGGFGYKEFYYNQNLFEDGELTCKGDNEYGQLGDGTHLDYEEDFLVVDEASFLDIFVGNYKEYVVALDYNNNIWCWGRGFGSTPEIIVSEAEFLGGFEN